MPEVTRLTVRVQPRSSRNEVVGFDTEGVMRVRVAAPPVGGEANKAVIDLLSSALGIPKSDVSIARGQTGRNKLVDVRGMSETEIRRRIDSTGR